MIVNATFRRGQCLKMISFLLGWRNSLRIKSERKKIFCSFMHIMVIRPLRLFGAQEGFYGKPLPTLILSHLQLDGKIEQGKKKKDREYEKVTERE